MKNVYEIKELVGGWNCDPDKMDWVDVGTCRNDLCTCMHDGFQFDKDFWDSGGLDVWNKYCGIGVKIAERCLILRDGDSDKMFEEMSKVHGFDLGKNDSGMEIFVVSRFGYREGTGYSSDRVYGAIVRAKKKGNDRVLKYVGFKKCQ